MLQIKNIGGGGVEGGEEGLQHIIAETEKILTYNWAKIHFLCFKNIIHENYVQLCIKTCIRVSEL